jgi:hypothetical protein
MGIVSTENRCRSAITYGLHERDVAGVFLGLQGIGVAIGGVVVGIGGLDARPIADGVIRTRSLEVLGALVVMGTVIKTIIGIASHHLQGDSALAGAVDPSEGNMAVAGDVS